MRDSLTQDNLLFAIDRRSCRQRAHCQRTRTIYAEKGADSVRIASARAPSTQKRCRQRTHCQRTRTAHKTSSRGETEDAHCQRMQAARTVLPANALPANAHSSARRTATIVAAWWHRKSLPALHHVRHGVCHGNHAIESLVKAISEIQLELHLTLTGGVPASRIRRLGKPKASPYRPMAPAVQECASAHSGCWHL